MPSAKTKTTSPTAPSAVFKVSQLAARWGCSEEHIPNLIEGGNLAALNLGIGVRKSWRIPSDAVSHFEKINSSLFDRATGQLLKARPVPKRKGGQR